MRKRTAQRRVASCATAADRFDNTIREPRPEAQSKNKGGPTEVSLGRAKMSAITYFPAEQYHRQTGLHFCVRDGNRCFPRLVVTDKRTDGLSPIGTSRA